MSTNSSGTVRILGIDPGYDRCGWAVLEDTVVIESGCVQTDKNQDLPTRYLQIQQTIAEVIDRLNPSVVAIEDLYFAKNTTTALKVAEVRGILVFTCKLNNLEVVMPKPSEIKLAITGNGQASKPEVQRMLYRLVQSANQEDGKLKTLQDDELDAIAAALTGASLYRASNLTKT